MPSHLRTPSDQLPGEGPVDRWTPARKEEVLRRIHAGEITMGDALKRWTISVEELDLWLVAYRKKGRCGLRVQSLVEQGHLL
jgi:hypothetical protein